MKLKKGDAVKLLPTWAHAGGPTAPIWGGPYGYLRGEVKNTFTHEHDSAKHTVLVEWANKQTGSFPESALAEMTPDDNDVFLDSRSLCGPCDRDIWVLIRTSLGNFGLSVVECLPFGTDNPTKYLAGISRMALPNIKNSDYNLVGTLITAGDYSENKNATLYNAVATVFNTWDLPPVGHVPLPLPEFESIEQAADCSPTTGPAVLLFHLPRNLCDYSDFPNAEAAS